MSASSDYALLLREEERAVGQLNEQQEAAFRLAYLRNRNKQPKNNEHTTETTDRPSK